MVLSSDLLSQFAKTTAPQQKTKTETVVYGTAKVDADGNTSVMLDGSEIATPCSATVGAKDNDRVMVTIKNHSATITGNLTSPSARIEEVNVVVKNVEQVENMFADYAKIEDLNAESARIDDLEATDLSVTNTLSAHEASINTLNANKVTVSQKLDALSASIANLDSNKVDTVDLTAINADIEDLKAKKLSASVAALTYANIDFSNITQTAMETFYANSGLIQDVSIGEATISGKLVGVTISGDLIEGNTIVAEKLVIKGDDGLYYALNTNGETVEAEQTDRNSLDGQVIKAKSITATKIDVKDLVAFGATIGGFNITESSLYSGVKASVENATNGIYLDKEGQMSLGNGNEYLKYYKDQNGDYHLVISAKSVMVSATEDPEITQSLEEILSGIQDAAYSAMSGSVEEFYQSSSPTSLSGDSWGLTQPTWTDGKYIWRRTKITYGDGSTAYSPSETGVCITGNTGAKGNPGVDYSQGKMLQTDPMFASGMNSATVYNNKSNGTVTITRASKSSDNPMTGTNYELVVKNAGEASPGLGGYVQNITSRANAVFIRRIIAKIPVGYTINSAQNSMGTGYTTEWLTPRAGTGKFTEYIYKYVCGSTGTFSSGGYVYISGTVGTTDDPVTWYVAYSTTFDMTNISDIKTYSDEAAKTATNYLGFSSNGLVVGDMTSSTLGKNVLIDSDSVDIRNGTTTLASFGASKVILGRNAEDSEIDLCDGAGRISANTASASTSYPHRNAILIDSQEIETESLRFVASTSNTYGASSTPTIQRGTELYMLRSSGSAESCARLKAEHKTTSSGAYTNSGVSAMTYDEASKTRLLAFASDSANSTYNQLNLYPTKTTMNKPLVLNGITHTGKNKVLWSGGYYMSDTQTATLSEAISAQPHGIVLLWSYYVDGASDNSNFRPYFIPKQFVASHPGKGVSMFMTNGTMSIAASKYVYISDTSIKGHANNDDAATAKTCGITSTPKNFVLRYVIGV